MALYDAFVSYSHAKDKPIAAALQSVIQTLGKPWYRRRALRIFRDDTSLSATPGLWPSIEQALGRSRFLILLASPEAAASEWVNKELSYWLEHRDVDALLIAVTHGELVWDSGVGDFTWHDGIPLPPVLAGRFPAEPKWVDLRPFREGADSSDAMFIEAGANFAAAIRGMPKEDLLSQEVRQQRRALTLAWSAVTTLAVLIVLAGWQWWEADHARKAAVAAGQIAIAERDKATRNFKLAHRTADSLVTDIAQGLRNVLGMPSGTVRKILETAKATFEQLAASAPDDLDLQRSRSMMLDEFGNTYLTLGDLDAALKDYRDSLAIAERLADADRSNAEWQRDLSVSSIKIGDVLVAQGKLDKALKAYSASLAIRERLAAADGKNTQRQRDLAVAHGGIANVLLRQGKLDGALKAYRASLAIVEHLTDTDRQNTEWQHDLFVSYIRIGDVLERQGKLGEALEAYRHGLVIAQRSNAAETGNTLWQGELSLAHAKAGDVLQAQHKTEEALDAYRESLAIIERLVTTDPGNTGWQRGLSISSEKIGDVLAAQGKAEDALKAFRRSLAIRERLAAIDRGNSEWQRDLSVSHIKIGDVLERQDKLVESLSAHREAFAIRQRLAAVDPSNAGWQRDLSVSHERVGDLLAAPDILDDALQAYRDSLAIRERLVALDSSNAGAQRDLSISHEKVGIVLRAQGKLADALKAYRGGLGIRVTLVAADRNNAQWHNDLQAIIQRIGDLATSLILARDFATALEASGLGTSIVPEQTWLYANYAHALMFLDRIEEAQALYLRHRGEEKVEGDKSWIAIIREDFADLREIGLTHPLMEEIEKRFAAGG